MGRFLNPDVTVVTSDAQQSRLRSPSEMPTKRTRQSYKCVSLALRQPRTSTDFISRHRSAIRNLLEDLPQICRLRLPCPLGKEL